MQIQNVRFIIAAITTFSAYAVYVSRVNLSIAIIAMVEEPHRSHSLNGSSDASQASESIRFNISTSSGFHENNGTLQLAPLNASNTNNSTPHREPHVFLTSEKSIRTPLISQEKFHWSQSEQGDILGAFFYGYIVFQIVGARMAEASGAKWILMAATAGSAVISLAFPLSTQLNSIHLLMVLRCVMGLCQSAFFPAAYVLFCRWLPERERAVLLPVMFMGSHIGNISTYVLSSHLINSTYGWPSVFYLSGLVCALVSLLWLVFGSSCPDDNWLISDTERQFIEDNVNNQSSESNSVVGDDDDTKDLDGAKIKRPTCCNNGANNHLLCGKDKSRCKSLKISSIGDNDICAFRATRPSKQVELVKLPSWPKLFKSVPIWVLIFSMYGNEWSTVVILYELPTYLNTALAYPIEKNGVINSFLQLSFTVASPIMSLLGAHVLDRHWFGMRKLHVRKLFQSVATFGQLLCFVSVPICGANRGLIIMFMFWAIVFKACSNAGDIMVPGDLSQEYAGTIFAFANSVGNTAGFFVPKLAGFFVKDAYDREQWTPFWLTTAAIMGCSGLIFLLLGQTSRQDYSRDDHDRADYEGDVVAQLGRLPEQRKAPIGNDGMKLTSLRQQV